jgi:hypothetical protein
MKIISLLVFVFALIGSWYLTHREQTIPESVHAGIQDELKQIIAEYVQKNLPNSKNLTFKRFWTETLQKNKIKASFIYSFDDTNETSGAVGMEIDGFAILNKVSENPDSTEWSFDELKILNNGIEFREPIRISPKDAANGEQVPEH